MENEAIKIIKIAVEMRNAQKAYFRTRTTTDLKKSKHLEKCFDDAVQNFLNPSKQLCFDDLNTQPAPWLDLPIEPLN